MMGHAEGMIAFICRMETLKFCLVSLRLSWMDVPYKIVGVNPARKSKGITVKPNVHVVGYVYG
ncbi:hypothetical protein ACFQDF_20305 [Ectobacillus funiculus]